MHPNDWYVLAASTPSPLGQKVIPVKKENNCFIYGSYIDFFFQLKSLPLQYFCKGTDTLETFNVSTPGAEDGGHPPHPCQARMGEIHRLNPAVQLPQGADPRSQLLSGVPKMGTSTATALPQKLSVQHNKGCQIICY